MACRAVALRHDPGDDVVDEGQRREPGEDRCDDKEGAGHDKSLQNEIAADKQKAENAAIRKGALLLGSGLLVPPIVVLNTTKRLAAKAMPATDTNTGMTPLMAASGGSGSVEQST